MSFLSPLTLQQIQQAITTGYNAQAESTGALVADTGPGSSLGPAFNSVAFAIFQQQQQILYVATISRLNTIPANVNGTPNPDVDSFVAPFGFTRLGASAASGTVTFSTPSAVATQIVIPVGAIVQTPGGLQFIVVAGGSNYNASLNGYPITIGNSSVNVSVQCLTTGNLGNVQAGQITQLYGGISGTQVPTPVNAVTNVAAFTNAVNFESDAALKARFTAGISTGRNSGTSFGVVAAALGTYPGLLVSYGDRINADGSTHNAYFTLVVAISGQGSTVSSSITGNVVAALEGGPFGIPPPARPAGISYQVIAPTNSTTITGSASLTLVNGSNPTVVIAAAQSAINSYISGIGLVPYVTPTNVSLLLTLASYTKVAAILWGIPGIANVDNLVINGGTSDITAPFAQILVPGSFTFTTSFPAS